MDSPQKKRKKKTINLDNENTCRDDLEDLFTL
jgi:hypothetical protein